MPVFLANAPGTIANSVFPHIGIMADSYGVSANSNAAGYGFVVQDAAVSQWTLAINSPIGAGEHVTAYLTRGNVPLDATGLSLVTSGVGGGALYIAQGFELGRTANGSPPSGTTLAAIGTNDNRTTDASGIIYCGSALVIAPRARSAIRYSLATDFTTALVGGGRVEAVISKQASAGVYAVPGTPMRGLITETTEARAEVAWPSRGTFTGMTVLAFSSTITSGGASPQFPTQVTLRVGGADTTLTQVCCSPFDYTTLASSVGVLFGDLVSLKMQALSWATGSYFHGFVQLAFLPERVSVPVPPPFLGVQAPQGADIHYWQTVASDGALSGWQLAQSPAGRITGVVALNVGLVDQRYLALPMLAPRSGSTLGEIGLVVTAGAAGSPVIELGLYQARSTNDVFPGDRLKTFGTINAGTAGLKTIATSYQLTDALYYIGFVTSGAITLRRGYDTTHLGVACAMTASGDLLSFWRTGSANTGLSLPATFPDQIAIQTGQDRDFPAIGLRFIG